MRRPDETPGPFWVKHRGSGSWNCASAEYPKDPLYDCWGPKEDRITYDTLGEAREVAKQGLGPSVRRIYRPKIA
jgi:hypothetical protein